MNDRLSDAGVEAWATDMTDECAAATALAREVQASRKLIADLRALHRPDSKIDPWCDEDWFSYPCRTIRMIDEAGL